MHLRRTGLAATAGLAMLTAAACGGGGATSTPQGQGASSAAQSSAAGSSAAGSAAASASGSSAASGGAAAGGGGTLTIWADDKRAPVLKKFGDQFGQENGVTVKVQAVSKDLQTNFVTAAQAGKGPDLVLGAHDWIGNLVQNGTIDPVQLTDDQKAQFNELAIKGVTFNGQIYGVPVAVENVALVRNTDLAPDAPTSIEDMVATAKKLKSAGKVTELFATPVGPTGDAYHSYPFYTSAGAYLFGKKDNGDYDPKDLGVTKPEAAAAFQKIAKLGEKGDGVLKRSITGENLVSLFSAKKVAFMQTGPWSLNDIKKSGVKYDITPMVGFEGGSPAKPFIGVQAMYVASKGKSKALAAEFATNYLTTPDLAVAFFQAEPRPPALTAALEQVKASNPDVQKFLDAGKDGDILPAIPEMATIWDPFGKAEAAVIGGADPDRSISAAAKAISSQIK